MNTLLLRLSGPMQSWGVQSRFSVRETGLEPSKSGVLGLVCAALGIDRADDDALKALAILEMGVRADREGVLKRDFHTAQNVLEAIGKDKKPTNPSTRYYLADAVFLVGLAGEELAQLQRIHAALRRPVWPLFLGRKAFVPSEPVWLEDGLKPNAALLDALKDYPFIGHSLPEDKRLRFIYEHLDGEQVRPDQPVSFQERRFVPRRVSMTFWVSPEPAPEVI